MDTPYFLIHEDQLINNITCFKRGMRDNWKSSKLAYSVKTNSLPWILSYMSNQGIMAEVVSDEEYELALLCGYSAEDIIFNGPIKTKELFEKAIKSGAYINIDSTRELQWLKELGPFGDNVSVGLRINLPTDIFIERDIEYNEHGFRFGFSETDNGFSKALTKVYDSGIKTIGLHLHCNSITRSADVYRSIAKYAVYLTDKYEIKLSYIDIGGGFFGGVPGKTTPQEYFSIIAEELNKTNNTAGVTLIAEPGSAIVGSVADLYTTVLDVKDTGKARIITTDGSRIHIDPLWKKKRYMYSLDTKDKVIFPGKQIICGYTCMDHDRLMCIDNEPELKKNDKIIYHRVGAYSMTFGGMFIRYYPDVYVQIENKCKKIRNRVSVQEYYRIEGGELNVT